MKSPARLVLAVALSCLAVGASLLHAEEDGASSPQPLTGTYHDIRVVDFPGEIEGVLAAYTKRQVESAEEDHVDCLVLRIDSPGGTVFDSMHTGDLLLGVPESIHVVAWVPQMAYSGAAMVSLSCDEIVMGRDAHLGDAQPITMEPGGAPKPVGEKFESPLRAKFRAYAERNGYPAALAEAMVSASLEVLQVRDPEGGLHYVEGQDFRDAAADAKVVGAWTKDELVQVGTPVVREGELLTMTAREAARFGFLRRTFEGGALYPDSESALLSALSARGARVGQREMSFSENACRLLLGFAGILSAVVMVAVLVTFFQGIGTTTFVGLGALALLLLINATADQLNGLPLLLIGVGVVLLAVEIFVIPGFGFVGIAGIALIGFGFLALALDVQWRGSGGAPSGRWGDTVSFGLQFVSTVLVGLVLLAIVSRYAPRIGPARRLLLSAPGGSPVSVAPSSPPPAPGVRGVAVSTLRPAGTMQVDGRLVDVVTEGGFVRSGRTVEVVAVEGNTVTVRAVEEGLGEGEDEGDA